MKRQMKIGFRCSEGNGNFENAVREVVRAEELGFDSAWVAEHHGWDVIWPSSHMALAGFATQTETIELGTSITLLPQANPVRLAGEVNLLDEISDGRFTLGIGVGWRRDEMENLGYDFDSRGRRMTEHLRAMRTLWENDTASFDGEYVSFDEFELSPDPVQTPHPPVWVGGGVDAALKRAAYLGDAWFPVWLPSITELEEMYDQYDHYVREAGDDPEQRERPLLRVAWIAEDSDEAREGIREFFDRLIEKYRERGAPIPDAMKEGLHGDFETFANERFVFGSPEECLEDITTLRDRLGTTHLVLKLYNPGVSHEQMMRFIELFGKEVIPQLEDEH